MSDELFDLPQSRISDLDAARIRFGLAKEAYEAAENAQDELPLGIPGEVKRELRDSEHHLAVLERRKLDRLKNQ